MSEIDWSKAPHDAEYWCEMQWFKTIDGEWLVWCPGVDSWAAPAYKAPDNFSWWGNAVARPTTPQWNGTGLPPVGVVCECRVKAGAPWVKCEVVARHKQYAIAYVDDDTVMLSCGIRFRPIRTTEQIAADERSMACDRIYGVISSVSRPGNRSDMAEALYDAGYRKTGATE